jgi:hypothetical protein
VREVRCLINDAEHAAELSTARAIVDQLSAETDAATRAAPEGCNMIV